MGCISRLTWHVINRKSGYQRAQVIIPNGELLFGRLVNWTFGEADIRLNLQLTSNTTRAVAQ